VICWFQIEPQIFVTEYWFKTGFRFCISFLSVIIIFVNHNVRKKLLVNKSVSFKYRHFVYMKLRNASYVHMFCARTHARTHKDKKETKPCTLQFFQCHFCGQRTWFNKTKRCSFGISYKNGTFVELCYWHMFPWVLFNHIYFTCTRQNPNTEQSGPAVTLVLGSNLGRTLTFLIEVFRGSFMFLHANS
jgi:hypothetical protein